jgi:TDG/mug DNA glycosylase family protein
MTTRIGLEAVVDHRTRVLLLGSLPGEVSLQAGEYYAHPRNAFWPLMSGLLNQNLVALPYSTRLDRLLDAGVGLWDVIGRARRQGSLDQAIRAPEVRDLASLISDLPRLRLVAFNGGAASRLGRRALGAQVQLELVDLPSSSPAHTLAYAAKAQAWSVLAPALINS